MRFIEEWKHWEERAEQALRISYEMRDPVARQTMLDVAAVYERMAVDARPMQRVIEASAEPASDAETSASAATQ